MQAFELLGGHASEVDLRPLCADAAQRHRAEVELPSGPLRAHTDAQTLQASLDALLVRARRQSRTRTRLSLTATERGVRLDVEDDGPPPVLPRGVEVDPFAPGAPAGLGRGLEMLLARSFIERGDGALRVGVGPLGGARVVLDLPGIVR